MTRALPRIIKHTACRRCLTTLPEDQYNAFLASRRPYPVDVTPVLSSKPLHHRTVAIKDNICTQGRTWQSSSPEESESSVFNTSCASHMLDGKGCLPISHSDSQNTIPPLRLRWYGCLSTLERMSLAKRTWMNLQWEARAPIIA